MANELPEVVPEVQSMPTTGWFCQTTGSARRRITLNSSGLKSGATDIEGIYDVAGVPGHTHNASAVISVDADYSAYRQRALTVVASVWGYGALALPVGLLTDSAEPDHAEERYDRAIERCVGYISLFPENCTGHIREPTRSIGEIRTLVAPKARLDTLTFTEEMRGWRVPNNHDDHKEESARDVLVSDFPDVHLDVRPLTTVRHAIVVANQGTSPGSLYMETPTFRYRIRSTVSDVGDGLGTIGTLADGTAWDGTLRFVWDHDTRSYRTLSEVSVTLHHVVEVAKADGAPQVPVYDTALDAVPAVGGQHAHRLTVTFPIQQTTTAFDGFCWFANLQNEEALNYATRQSGLSLAPRLTVEVTGVQNHIGPFQWIGLPAYRVPVGGSYAHPASDILQEALGDGTVADLQYNHWDKFDAFARRASDVSPVAFDGLLRYQWRQQEADRLDAAGTNPGTQSRQGPNVFDLTARSTHLNGGFFFSRAGGILSQLTADHYPAQPNFNQVSVRQYRNLVGGGNLAVAHVDTGGIRTSNREKDDINAQATQIAAAPAIVYEDDGSIAEDSTFWDTSMMGLSTFTLESKVGFRFSTAAFGGAVIPALTPFVKDRFCALPATPLFYQVPAGPDGVLGASDFHGDDLFCGKVVNGFYRYVPRVICNSHAVLDDQLQLRYDLSNAIGTTAATRVTGTLENPGAIVGDAFMWVRGWSLWLHPGDGVESNFDIGAAPAAAQLMRNTFRDLFRTGSQFPLAGGAAATDREWYSLAGVGGSSILVVQDVAFAMKATDCGGIYFETQAILADGHKMCLLAPSWGPAQIVYEAAGGAGTAFAHGRIETALPVYIWDNAAAAVRRATHAEVHANRAEALNMYVLGPDWFRTHSENDPYAAIRADSERLGAVFQSVKRISQHICAPVINPNLRIGASAPLNHDTRHLPPELRDFRLQLSEIDWGRLQTPRVTLGALTTYEFKGGTQKVGSEQNIMYLPQFREFKTPVRDNEFEFNCFSELGSPSYFCFFCRSTTTDILQQPLIKTLSIFNETTQRKSNSVTALSIGQMYHLTQRNVHPGAEYGRVAYNRRQTVLLSAEDVGLLGLRSFEFQKAKRVNYVFSGTTDRPGQLFVVLVYNNRGLHIDGRRLQLVTLHE